MKLSDIAMVEEMPTRCKNKSYLQKGNEGAKIWEAEQANRLSVTHTRAK